MNEATKNTLWARALGLSMQTHANLNGDWSGIEAFSELEQLQEASAHDAPVRFSVIEQQSLRVLYNRVSEDAQNIFAELVSAYNLGKEGN